MKTVCVYHSIDLDGYMSAAIVKHWGMINNEPPINFIGYNYGQPIPDLSEYDRVIMCDISFPKEEMNKLLDKLKHNFYWIDHHISAIKDNFEENDDYEYTKFIGLRSTRFAACELTWKYLMSNPIEKFGEIEDQNPMPEIVRLLGRYDCFGHKGTDEEQKVLEFQYGARSVISNYKLAYEYLLNDLNHSGITYSIQTSGIAIYQYLCTEAKQIYKNGFEIKFWIDTIPTNEEIRPIHAIGICNICGKEENEQLIRYYFSYENDKCDCHSPYHFDLFDCCKDCKPVAKNKVPKKFICINKERFNPINFGIDYHKDGYDGCACFYYDGVAKLWKFSLYNDNDKVDCSQIAKQYGGGGHKGAAGFVVKNLNDILK